MEPHAFLSVCEGRERLQMETWEQDEVIYDGAIFRVRKGEVRLDDGTLAPREVMDHPGGVAVVPYHDGKVYLVRQYRIAVGDEVLELPAGRLEGDEDPAERAAAELEEEAGLTAGRLVHVATCYASPGCSSELDHIFLGLDVRKTEARPEYDEVLEPVELTLEQVEDMLDHLVFNDAKTIIGLRELQRYLDKHHGPRH